LEVALRSCTVDLRDTPAEAAFRAEVRAFIAEHAPAPGEASDPMDPHGPRTPAQKVAFSRWEHSLGNCGWIAPHWPKEYGGAGLTHVEQFIFNEEMAEARAPEVGHIGITHIGPILILYGTEQQRKEHLPRITAGETVWCQGYSEPGAGSDLASLQTRAVRNGDEFLLNGQKIWSSNAHNADWMFLLARTDPDAPKHRGISMFLLDLKSPGVAIQPIVNLAGEHHFNQEFFEDVHIPAANLVGEENRGWYIGAALLDLERSMIRPVVGLRHTVVDLMQFARDGAAAGISAARPAQHIRAELAERVIEADTARLLSYRIVSMQKRGLMPNYEASMGRMFYAETDQRIARTGMHLIGLYGNLVDSTHYGGLIGRVTRSYLRTVANTIAGGSSEIQRNVIATRGLGLPRG
jgi:alkylation response protein AidB-like acyl-CoA dehydrogenase